jgi:exopolyphosphatase/guanosine-5'-triphosphate,3'-diphosphate pyrophosphatase
MGVMWDLTLREMRRDRREQSVRDFARKFHVDEARAGRVADDALALLEQLKPGSDAMGRLVYWSALVHEVGQAVSQTGHHKHAAYMVENADLPGFTTREQRTMSRLLLAQKGNLRKVGDLLSDADFARAVVALRLAIVFMHARITVAEAGARLRMKNRIDLELPRALAAGHPTLSYWIEKEQEHWDEVGVDLSLRTST